MTSVETEAQKAARLMNTEDMTNSIWNSLLSKAFPWPTYVAVPEYHFTSASDNGFADLAVLKIDGLGKVGARRIMLLFEGKKAGGSFAKMADPIRQSQRALSARGKGETPLVIAALGVA